MKLSLRLALRDLRSGFGGLGLLWLCLAVAIAGLASVTSLASSVDRAIASNGRELLGGDLALSVASRQATVIAIGEARPAIAEALGASVPVHGAADMSSAVRTAFASASPGGTVVLAPACASFDMFRDYAQRGLTFKQEVRRLQEEWSVTREQ